LQIVNSADTVTISGLHRESFSMKNLMMLMKEYPTVSIGVLLWVRELYKDQRFQKSSCFTSGVKTLLYLIRCGARWHPLQRAQAFFILCQIFGMKAEGVFATKLLEIKRIMLDEMIKLMQMGYVMPVLTFVKNNSVRGTIDHSLIRHFVIRLLQCAKPPYSRAFIREVNNLLQEAIVARALRFGTQQIIQRLLNGFKQACAEQKRLEENEEKMREEESRKMQAKAKAKTLTLTVKRKRTESEGESKDGDRESQPDVLRTKLEVNTNTNTTQSEYKHEKKSKSTGIVKRVIDSDSEDEDSDSDSEVHDHPSQEKERVRNGKEQEMEKPPSKSSSSSSVLAQQTPKETIRLVPFQSS